jgi:CheY-like chemotaxis protein
VDFLGAVRAGMPAKGAAVLAYPVGRPDPEQSRIIEAAARAHQVEVVCTADEFRERFILLLAHPHPTEPEQPGSPRQYSGLRGRKVLLVDDDTRNVLALAGMLELNGMKVTHASNGRKGIEALQAHPDVDVILMDVMMPEMDGYATTAAIRRMPDFDRLPIIMVTAKAMAGDRDKSLASGASDYITKPVDADDLLACIGRWLNVPTDE